MSFLAHLGELRYRIMVCVAAVGVGFAVTFSYSDQIINWLARPCRSSWPSWSRPSRSG